MSPVPGVIDLTQGRSLPGSLRTSARLITRVLTDLGSPDYPGPYGPRLAFPKAPGGLIWLTVRLLAISRCPKVTLLVGA